VADDQYSRIYYTEAGILKVRGYDGGAVTRTVGIRTPAKPTTTTTWKWTPEATGTNEIALNVQVVTNCNSTIQTNEPVATLTGFTHNADGTTKLEFSVASGRHPTVANQPGATFNASVRINLRLKIGSKTYPTESTFGVITGAGSYELKDDDANVYATPEVSNVSGGPTVDWNQVATGTTFSYTPEYGVFTLTVTLDSKYSQTTSGFAVYCVTLVDDWGQEGPPSVASDQVEIKPGQGVTLSFAAGSVGGANIDKTRIYRSAYAGAAAETQYYYVGEVEEGVTSYTDTKRDADLAEVMPETENPPGYDDPGLSADDDPNDELLCNGLVALPYGSLAAFYKKEVYFSEPFLPYSWPTKYRLTFDYDIVGLGVSGNDLIVLTTGTPYLVSGYHPENLSQTRLMINQSCVSKRGICNVGKVVCYPSPDGMVMISGGQASLATDKYFTRDDWQAVNPSTMIAESHDGSIFAFTSAGTWIFDFDEGLAAVTTTDQTAYALFSDLESDILYIATAAGVKAWAGDTANRTLTWKSKQTPADRMGLIRSGRIRAEGNVTLKLYADGILVHTETVTSSAEFRLALLDGARLWEFQVESAYAIDEIILFHRNLIQANQPVIHLKGDDQTAFSWRAIEFDTAKTGTFSCAKVFAEEYPVTFTIRGDNDVLWSKSVTSSAAFRIPVVPRRRLIELDLQATGMVYELVIAKSMEGLKR
jgi:hypothetical protein